MSPKSFHDFARREAVSINVTGSDLIDDFEDGDANDTVAAKWGTWTTINDDGIAATSGSNVIAGTYSGLLRDEGSDVTADIAEVQRDSDTTSPGTVRLRVRITFPDGNFSNVKDSCDVQLYDRGGTQFYDLSFLTDKTFTGIATSETWSAGTVYTVTFDQFDFTNETLRVQVEGSDVDATDTVSFDATPNGLGAIRLRADGSNEQQTIDLYVDDIRGPD